MKLLLKYSICLALAVFFTVTAMAQPDNDGPRGADPERRKEILQKILEHKHAKLREVLNLDDESAKKFFDIYGPAEQELARLVAERNAMELKLLRLTQGDYSDSDVDPTLEEIERLNNEIKARFLRLNDSLKPILTPRQRARLAVFEHEFNRRLRERIREHRRDHRGPGPGGPPDGPPDRRKRHEPPPSDFKPHGPR
jgi:Spy/CpxP family protein refolding chaperone